MRILCMETIILFHRPPPSSKLGVWSPSISWMLLPFKNLCQGCVNTGCVMIFWNALDKSLFHDQCQPRSASWSMTKMDSWRMLCSSWLVQNVSNLLLILDINNRCPISVDSTPVYNSHSHCSYFTHLSGHIHDWSSVLLFVSWASDPNLHEPLLRVGTAITLCTSIAHVEVHWSQILFVPAHGWWDRNLAVHSYFCCYLVKESFIYCCFTCWAPFLTHRSNWPFCLSMEDVDGHCMHIWTFYLALLTFPVLLWCSYANY